MRVRTIVVAGGLLASSTLAAQQQGEYRAQANYIEVDAVVTDAKGHFVPGLTAADFQVFESNRPQRIDAFSYVDLPVPGRPAAAPLSPARVNPELGAPGGELNGRFYLLYFTGASALDRLQQRQAGEDFVKHAMQPGDVAAVWDPETQGMTLTFTNVQADLLKAIDPVARVAPSASAYDQTSRLQDAVDWMSNVQGRRKSLLLFSAGWPTLMLPVTATFRPGPGAESFRQDLALEAVDWFSGMRGDSIFFNSPAEITGRSDVHVYTIDTRGLVAPPTIGVTGPNQLSSDVRVAAEQVSAGLSAISAGVDTLRSIADETGGLSIVNSNDLTAGFRRIEDDNSRYYVLGYASPHTAHDNAFVRIDVKTTRPNLTVRARKGYVAR